MHRSPTRDSTRGTRASLGIPVATAAAAALALAMLPAQADASTSHGRSADRTGSVQRIAGRVDDQLHGTAAGTKILFDTATVAPDDVWAVGYVWDGSTETATVRHWDGNGWKAVHVPVPQGATWTELDSVAATSADDVWVAGYSSDRSTQVTWVDHFDGKHWSVVTTPNPSGIGVSGLTAVSASSPDNAWATGIFISSQGGVDTLTEHWNGKAWTIVASPNQQTNWNTTRGDVALPGGEAWNVGESSDDNLAYTASAEHWNGKAWKLTKLDLPQGVVSTVLMGVSGVSSDDVWAAGCSSNTQAGIFCTRGVDSQTGLVEHWDGKRWSLVATALPKGATGTSYSNVEAISADDVWLVGAYTNGSVEKPLTEHWDGHSWQVVAVPLGHQTMVRPEAVAGTGASDAWLVGYGAPKQQVAAHWDGKHWTQTNP